MIRRNLIVVDIAMLLIVIAAPVAFAGGETTFTPLGQDTIPSSATPDGSKIVGWLGYSQFFYWTRAEGLVLIGGGCTAGTAAISGNGNTIVACATDENGTGQTAKWLGGTDWQMLGSVPGGLPCDRNLSSTWGINSDGSTSVGLVWLTQLCHARAGKWDLVNGGPATDLGSLVPGRASRANGISGDSHIIVGWQDDEVGQRLGARWVDGVEEYFLTPASQHVGEIQATNFDGTVMIGQHYPYGANPAWVWTAKHGFSTIDTGQVYSFTSASAMSEDGSVIGGIAREPVSGSARGWFFYKNRLIWMDEYLAEKKLAPGWRIAAINVVSADGSTLVGLGLNPDGFQEGFIIENFK